MWYIFLIPIAVLILGAVIKSVGTTPSQVLNKKFIELGTLSGKSYDEIISIAGTPNSVSKAGLETVCQWIQPAYHIVLLFDEHMICLGVSSETKVDETTI